MKQFLILIVAAILFFGISFVQAQELPPLPSDTGDLIGEDQLKDINFNTGIEDTTATTATGSEPTTGSTTKAAAETKSTLSDTGLSSLIVTGLASILAFSLITVLLRHKKWKEK